eukprot:scaffold12081_cov110-Alexandrium_tamarense.AAC.1
MSKLKRTVAVMIRCVVYWLILTNRIEQYVSKRVQSVHDDESAVQTCTTYQPLTRLIVKDIIVGSPNTE